jgi:hypothetical protein
MENQQQTQKQNHHLTVGQDGYKGDTTWTIESLQKQLERIKEERLSSNRLQKLELDQLQRKLFTSKQQLDRKLSDRGNQAIYIRFLKHDYPQYQRETSAENTSAISAAATSMYLLQQEAPLLSALHRTFLILPNQMSKHEQFYEGHVYPYFRRELHDAQLELVNVNEQLVRRVSQVAQENHDMYDSYQEKLEDLQQEICVWKRKLAAVTRTALATSKSLDSDDELLSETEHSITDRSDDDDYDIDNNSSSSSGFFNVTKLLLTPTERLSHSISHNIQKMSTAAAGKFQLPFGN